LNKILSHLDRYILFWSVLVTMSSDLRTQPFNKMADVITFFTLKILKRKVNRDLQTSDLSDQHALLSILSLIILPAKTQVKSLFKHDTKELGKNLSTHYNNIILNISTRKVSEGYKNFRISFSEYFCPDSELNPLYRLSV